jgi:hypothetical protein
LIADAKPKQAGNEKMKNEILNALRTYGWQSTSTLAWSFGSGFGQAIKELHNEGKVQKVKNGWKAV